MNLIFALVLMPLTVALASEQSTTFCGSSEKYVQGIKYSDSDVECLRRDSLGVNYYSNSDAGCAEGYTQGRIYRQNNGPSYLECIKNNTITMSYNLLELI